jgi:anti-sigma regulatory factor (Ser/Thr protein kinase)
MGRYLHLTLRKGRAATAELRHAIDLISDRCHLNDEQRFDLKLAVTEAVTNALKGTPEGHAAEVTLAEGEGAVEVEVLDSGVFSPLRAALDRGPEAEGGRGIAIMFALVDEVEFERTGAGTRVRMRKHISPAEGTLRLAG